MRSARLFQLVAALALIASGPAARARGLPHSFFAMSTVDSGDFPKPNVGAMGHYDFSWTQIEPKKGEYHFQGLDQLVSDLRARKLVDSTNTANVAITLGETPQWAVRDASACKPTQHGVRCTGMPKDIADWTAFVTKLMQHYDGKTMPHLRYVELWNEANEPGWWSGTIAELVSLAKAAYPIVHADPHTTMLTPSVTGPSIDGPTSQGAAWMAQYLDAGGDVYADAGAFHGYVGVKGTQPYPWPEQGSPSSCTNGCYGSIVKKVATMRRIFDTHGSKKHLAGKPMLQTEGSWGDANITDPATQVAWLARWYLLQAGLHTKHQLEMASWFTWGLPATFTWGTIENTSNQPTAAGHAYDQVVSWLAGNEVSECASSQGVWSCTVATPQGAAMRAVWTESGAPQPLTVSAFGSYRTLDGQLVAIQQGIPVQIGAQPILLQGKPLPVRQPPHPPVGTTCPPVCPK